MATLDEKRKCYLIRLDGDPLVMFNTEDEALKAMNSIADEEEKKRQEPRVEVFRRSLQEGREIKISTKYNGLIYSSALKEVANLDVIPVPRFNQDLYTEKIARFKAAKNNAQ